MSHLRLREEKNCLNCGNEVIGRYCHHCGQENVELKESIWHFIRHFFEDITHFDGKIWKTTKALLLKPAALTKAYMEGKRQLYIHPIRMYLFLSFLFFLFVFTYEPKEIDNLNDKNKISDTIQVNTHRNVEPVNFKFDKDDIDQYATVASYDTAQSKLSEKEKAGWMERYVNRQQIDIRNKYRGDYKAVGRAAIEKFSHNFSKLLYVSLPFFAMATWVLYRRKKQFYFVDHLIFAIHTYCAIFTLFFINKLGNSLLATLFHTKPDLLNNYTLLISIGYIFISLKNLFQQSNLKTFFKLFALLTMNLIVLSILVLIFFIFSLFSL